MTHNRITPGGHSLSQVHSVRQDGSGCIELLSDFSHPDNTLYTALLVREFVRFGFHQVISTECTTNVDAVDQLQIGTPSATENAMSKTESNQGETVVQTASSGGRSDMVLSCPTSDYTVTVPWQEKVELAGFGWCVEEQCEPCGHSHFMVVIDE